MINTTRYLKYQAQREKKLITEIRTCTSDDEDSERQHKVKITETIEKYWIWCRAIVGGQRAISWRRRTYHCRWVPCLLTVYHKHNRDIFEGVFSVA